MLGFVFQNYRASWTLREEMVTTRVLSQLLSTGVISMSPNIQGKRSKGEPHTERFVYWAHACTNVQLYSQKQHPLSEWIFHLPAVSGVRDDLEVEQSLLPLSTLSLDFNLRTGFLGFWEACDTGCEWEEVREGGPLLGWWLVDSWCCLLLSAEVIQSDRVCRGEGNNVPFGLMLLIQETHIYVHVHTIQRSSKQHNIPTCITTNPWSYTMQYFVN